jgi:hypothetical protein
MTHCCKNNLFINNIMLIILIIIIILLILCIYRKERFANNSNDPSKPFVNAFSNKLIEDINLRQ